MSEHYEKVKRYLNELEIPITRQVPEEGMVIVEDEENGIKNLIIDCEDPIVIFEQVVMTVPSNPGDFFKRLLQINRTLVHGAFVLDEQGQTVLFRDTLQLDNLDKNEIEGTIRALSLAMAENASELIEYSKK
ncbi:MAG TPA: YbjN domain-containing protein [Thermodesulfovibrionia bacterium]|nr:YbjN domain-containing protein [Thermodesulfovibrionia bacterium]